MERVYVLRNRRNAFVVVLAGALVAAAGACTEDLDTASSCGILCPQAPIGLRDTVIDPYFDRDRDGTGSAVDSVGFDTTLYGFPPQGTELYLPVATMPELDTRAIARFDTLISRFRVPGDTTQHPVVAIDSAQLRIRLNRATDINGASPEIVRRPVTFEVYDVDTTAADSSNAALVPLFRPERFLGSYTLDTSATADTITAVTIPLSNEAVLERITSGRRLRVGIRLVSDTAALVRLHTVESGVPADLRYDPVREGVADSLISFITVGVTSRTPGGASSPIAGELRDYLLVVRGTPLVPATQLGVGGLPGRRSYLRFDIPQRLIDSTTIVRATLELTQVPNRLYPGDTARITVYPQVVLASSRVTDPARAALILSPPFGFGLDSLLLAPGDSGEVRVQFVDLVRRAWASFPGDTLPRAIVLRTRTEGALPAEVRFFSREADASVRPRLRLSYVPRIDFGLP